MTSSSRKISKHDLLTTQAGIARPHPRNSTGHFRRCPADKGTVKAPLWSMFAGFLALPNWSWNYNGYTR